MANNLNVGRIPYSLGIRPTNPSDKDSEKKIFAYAQAETVNTRQLANHWAAHTSSFSKGECVGIIEDLCAEIQEMLLEGHAVFLEGLGKLYITLSSEGVDDAEKFSPAAHIKRVNVRFAADKAFLGTINATVTATGAGYQAIIDNKAYSKYSISNDHRNRMVHNYINGLVNYSQSPLPLAFFSYIAGGFSPSIDSDVVLEATLI